VAFVGPNGPFCCIAYAVNNLLRQVGIVLLKIRFFERDVRGFPKFLMRLTEVAFKKVNPCFLDIRPSIPICDVSLEASCFVKNDICFGDSLALCQWLKPKFGIINVVFYGIEDGINGIPGTDAILSLSPVFPGPSR
jgi:hypothetical protein